MALAISHIIICNISNIPIQYYMDEVPYSYNMIVSFKMCVFVL